MNQDKAGLLYNRQSLCMSLHAPLSINVTLSKADAEQIRKSSCVVLMLASKETQKEREDIAPCTKHNLQGTPNTVPG